MIPQLSRSRSTPIVVDTSSSSVVGKTIIVIVDLVRSLLQKLDHSIERTKTIFINRAARVRIRDGHNSVIDYEPNLLCLVPGWAGHDLSGKVGGEWNELACDKGIGALVSSGAERWTFEQGCQVESSEGIEDDNFMSGIGVDGLIEREIR